MPRPTVHRLTLYPALHHASDSIIYIGASECGRTLVAGQLVTTAAANVTCLLCRELRPADDMAVGIKLERAWIHQAAEL